MVLETRTEKATMKRILMMTALAATLASGTPAHAQALFGDAYTFLKAVKDRDVLKAKAVIDRPGSTLINSRDGDTGETALHLVTRGRDAPWMRLLLQEGADVNARDKSGATPLLTAVEQRFLDGARLLVAVKAKLDLPNREGETPLNKAVQLRDGQMVRLLIEAGANPDETDNAGLSARDYAKQDRRAAAIARLLDAPKSAATAEAARP